VTNVIVVSLIASLLINLAAVGLVTLIPALIPREKHRKTNRQPRKPPVRGGRGFFWDM